MMTHAETKFAEAEQRNAANSAEIALMKADMERMRKETADAIRERTLAEDQLQAMKEYCEEKENEIEKVKSDKSASQDNKFTAEKWATARNIL